MYSFREHFGPWEWWSHKTKVASLAELKKTVLKENADLLLSQSSECMCSRNVCLLKSVKTINDSSWRNMCIHLAHIPWGSHSFHLYYFCPYSSRASSLTKLTASIQNKTDMQIATLECLCQVKLHVWLSRPTHTRPINDTNKQKKALGYCSIFYAFSILWEAKRFSRNECSRRTNQGGLWEQYFR